MPAHRRRTEAGDVAFFAALALGESVRVASMVAGCSRQALYQRRISDHVFAQRWSEAAAAARQSRRDALPRKRPGITRPVFAVRGKLMSDGIVLARLKAILPARYREAAARPSGAAGFAVVNAADDPATLFVQRDLRDRGISGVDIPPLKSEPNAYSQQRFPPATRKFDGSPDLYYG